MRPITCKYSKDNSSCEPTGRWVHKECGGLDTYIQDRLDEVVSRYETAKAYISMLLEENAALRADFVAIFGCIAGVGSVLTEEEALRQINLVPGVQDAAAATLSDGLTA